MHKKSLGGRLSANPVRISAIEKEERRRTQTLKNRSASTSDETHIPRPRVRSSSVDTAGRKSSLKPPARIQHSQYGFGTPQACATTPRTSQVGSIARLQLPPGSSVRGRSPSAERASLLAGKLPIKDSRPLGDKSFQTEMLSKIDSYLRSIEQSSLINSNGSLKPITLKMFVEVSDLLVKLLDVKQPLTMVNYVEELPKIAKKLHYPGQINKSWLKTANAMHSWAQVLGWLSWLVEACIIRDLAWEHFQLENLPFKETEDAGRAPHELKLQFLLNAYKAWNEEKSEEESVLTEEYLRAVSNMMGIGSTCIEIADKEYQHEDLLLEEAKEEGQKADAEIRQLETTLNSKRNKDVIKDAEIKKVEDTDRKNLEEAEIFETESSVLQKTLLQLKDTQNELEAQINTQPMSIAERDKINELCQVKENQIRELEKHLNVLQQETYTLQVQLTAVRKTLDDVVFKYNREIYCDLDSEAGIDELNIALPVSGTLDQNIADELQRKANLVTDFRRNKEKQNETMKSVIEANQEKLEALDEEKVKLEAKKQEECAKINECKDRCKAIKAATKAKKTELKELLEHLKQDNKDMEDKMPSEEEESKEIAEAKEKIQALFERKHYFEQSARLFFDEFFKIFAVHSTKLACLFEKQNES